MDEPYLCCEYASFLFLILKVNSSAVTLGYETRKLKFILLFPNGITKPPSAIELTKLPDASLYKISNFSLFLIKEKLPFDIPSSPNQQVF